MKKSSILIYKNFKIAKNTLIEILVNNPVYSLIIGAIVISYLSVLIAFNKTVLNEIDILNFDSLEYSFLTSLLFLSLIIFIIITLIHFFLLMKTNKQTWLPIKRLDLVISNNLILMTSLSVIYLPFSFIVVFQYTSVLSMQNGYIIYAFIITTLFYLIIYTIILFFIELTETISAIFVNLLRTFNISHVYLKYFVLFVLFLFVYLVLEFSELTHVFSDIILMFLEYFMSMNLILIVYLILAIIIILGLITLITIFPIKSGSYYQDSKTRVFLKVKFLYSVNQFAFYCKYHFVLVIRNAYFSLNLVIGIVSIILMKIYFVEEDILQLSIFILFLITAGTNFLISSYAKDIGFKVNLQIMPIKAIVYSFSEVFVNLIIFIVIISGFMRLLYTDLIGESITIIKYFQLRNIIFILCNTFIIGMLLGKIFKNNDISFTISSVAGLLSQFLLVFLSLVFLDFLNDKEVPIYLCSFGLFITGIVLLLFIPIKEEL